jgi:hypothetical protein
MTIHIDGVLQTHAVIEARHQERLKEDPHYQGRLSDGTLEARYAERHGLNPKDHETKGAK